MTGQYLAGLLAAFGSATPPFTLLRMSSGVRMEAPRINGVVALLVLSGVMHLDIQGEGTRIVRPGRLVLLPADTLATLSPDVGPATTIASHDCLTSRDGWMLADGTRGHPAALVVCAGRIAGTGPEALRTVTISSVAKCNIGKRLFALLRSECENGGQAALANALMHACVVQGLRRAIDRISEDAPVPANRGLLASTISRIRAHPGEPHSVERLALQAGMSRSSFIRHFKRIMHIGPSEYVQKVRLEEARLMLMSTDLPIKTIATRSGFASRSHFSRAFRAAFGQDPSGYRDEDRTKSP